MSLYCRISSSLKILFGIIKSQGTNIKMMATATTHTKINNNRFAFSDLVCFTLCIQVYLFLPKAA